MIFREKRNRRHETTTNGPNDRFRMARPNKRYLRLATALPLGILLLFTAPLAGTSQVEAAPLRTMKNTAFTYGEKLTFAVRYKFVTAGYAVMSVGSKPVTVSGRKTYPVKFSVRTTSSFDKIFRVRDIYRTWIDVDGLFPWKFQQQVREGDYKRDFSANIDQRAHKARTTQGTFKVPSYVQDVLSAFYYARAYDLRSMKKGQSFTVKNFYGKKAHTLRVRMLGKQTVETDAGTFRCLKLEPMVAKGGLFKHDGRIFLWVTDDARKMPVKVSASVPIGSIDSELVKYSGVKGGVAAKIK